MGCCCLVHQKRTKDVRKTIIEDNKLEAIIKMPSGIFKPYAGVSTAILFLQRRMMVVLIMYGSMI